MTNLTKAAEGQTSTMAEAARASEAKKAEREQKRLEREQRARAAQPQADPIEAALAMLTRTAEIVTGYGDFRLQRDAAIEREQQALVVYRDLYGKHRSRLNDTRWCATDQGRSVVTTLKALRDEVDRLSGITPMDVDYRILWAARIASFYSDYVESVLTSAQPLVSPNGNADAILVAIDDGQEEALRAQGAQNKFFFRAEGQTFYPNGYKQRPEVQRVVRELQQLWGRTTRSFQMERRRTRDLLTQHGPDRVDSAGAALDLVKLLNVAEASPYEGAVDVALYVSKFEFLAPGETEPRYYRGVVHLSVENTTDEETGGAAKLLTIHEVVGTLERTLPPAGMRWLIPLEKVGKGELGIWKGQNRIDDPQPWALLRYVQQTLFVAGKRSVTIGQAIGLDAYKGYEERRRGRKGKSGGPMTQPDGAQQAEEQLASAPSGDGNIDAEASGAEAPALESQAPAVEAPAVNLPPQRPRKPRGPRKPKSGAKAAGDNGAIGAAEPTPPASN